MNIYEKLGNARLSIASAPMKKSGKNKFSNYDYFTPTQVAKLVSDACNEFGLFTHFNLKRDEFGYFGQLDVVNIENSNEVITFQMRTDVPDIKATNRTQQYGGCDTYTKRYLLMNAFDIVDNNLDFDSQDNTPKMAPAPKKAPAPVVKKLANKIKLTPKHEKWNDAVLYLSSDGGEIGIIQKKYSLTDEHKQLLIEQAMEKINPEA